MATTALGARLVGPWVSLMMHILCTLLINYLGIGYVEEVYARLQHHLYDLPAGSTQANTTLDEMESTFPLNQTLYFDFSHDTNIMSVITAFGLKQFAQPLPVTGPPPDQQLIVSHVSPFATRMVGI